MPSISVILPFRDAASTIQRAVESILNQSYSDFEFIIINDGSTDLSEELLNQYTDPRIKKINLAPSGIVTALNEGLYISQGKYIARMDADDYSYPDRLSKQFDYLENNPEVGIVASKVNYKGSIEDNYGYFYYVEWTNQLISSDDIFINRFVESPISHPSVMMKQDIVKKYGNYADGEFPEDYELWLRLMSEGVKIAKVDEVLLDWYDDKNRLSRRHSKYSMDAFYEIKTQYFLKWYTGYFRTPPPILVWGTGKSVLKKSAWIEKSGMEVSGYIDIVDKENNWINNKPVFHYEDLPKHVFILSYVGDREGRLNIHRYLIENGYTEGNDFYMMA